MNDDCSEESKAVEQQADVRSARIEPPKYRRITEERIFDSVRLTTESAALPVKHVCTDDPNIGIYREARAGSSAPASAGLFKPKRISAGYVTNIFGGQCHFAMTFLETPLTLAAWIPYHKLLCRQRAWRAALCFSCQLSTPICL